MLPVLQGSATGTHPQARELRPVSASSVHGNKAVLRIASQTFGLLLLQCLHTTDGDYKACGDHFEDYFECLHHKKEVRSAPFKHHESNTISLLLAECLLNTRRIGQTLAMALCCVHRASCLQITRKNAILVHAWERSKPASDGHGG